MLVFNSGVYRRLEIFPETELDESTCVTLESGGNVVSLQGRNRSRLVFDLAMHTTYSLCLGGATVGLMYLSECDRLMDTGVHFLEGDDTACSLPHFMPYKGWMGAPCGLCFYKGFFHMFYEWNPFSEKCGNLYWGHAVSRDMLSWKHLPVLFEPAQELQLARYRTGGAFSGSAAVKDDRVRLCFTRSLAAGKTGEILRQYQVQAESRDMLHFSEELPVMLDLPNAAGPFFCNPKITEAEGGRLMGIGSTWRGKAALLLYRENGSGWEYTGPLLKEKGASVWENPDFFPIGKAYAALGTFVCDGKRTTRWYTGGFHAGHFRVRKRGCLDFGGDFSAPQTFSADGRRLLIGRIARPDGSGCASLPREVITRGGRVRTKPAAEVHALKGEAIYEGRGESVTLSVKDTAFMAALRLSEKTEFSLCFGRQNGAPLYLHCKSGMCFFEGAEGKSADADTEAVRAVTLFADGCAVEVFLNDGEAAGAKGVCGLDGTFSVAFAEPEKVRSFSVYPLKTFARDEAWDEIPEGETFAF